MRATLPFAKEWTLAELEAEREKTVHYIAEADLAMEEATKNALALMSAELEAQGRKIEHLREWEKRHWMEANSKEYRSAKRAKAKRDKQRRYAEALSLPGAERMFEKWKLKATSFNGARGRFETAGDVIRHNFALVESLWEIKTVYSWRLYEYSPNSWS